ncbi:TBC1 domain member 22b [Ichthyophthirius multifiliis]|uniref:TBC1 domain member 22b n=1 Tax=Ichthyophthirius multifiliis TaxID=5932 RepID=G0R6H0_ICHMU|nr:TBC1 domain member 22b [Ichthyophthirius multifiliis]EGR26927.1 TBC1 domain member 22b [Ichthyophthirius multifiliis]|eukprot:XP_004023811.1 TBC1 domain member 22b [Ichthyophthirius multifiliis]
MSFVLKQIKKVFNPNEIKNDKQIISTQNKLNFTTIYNKNEDYIKMDQLQNDSHQISRIEKFKQILDQRIIDYDKLQSLSWDGIPSQFRGKVWRVLLKYLPTNRDTQENTLNRKRKDYADMVDTYFSINEQNDRDKYEQKGLDQVICDAERTLPYSKLFRDIKIKDILVRVLFIWNVRHPACGYVQGINDIVTSFIIVFLSEYCTVNIETLQIPEDFEKQHQSNFKKLKQIHIGVQVKFQMECQIIIQIIFLAQKNNILKFKKSQKDQIMIYYNIFLQKQSFMNQFLNGQFVYFCVNFLLNWVQDCLILILVMIIQFLISEYIYLVRLFQNGVLNQKK